MTGLLTACEKDHVRGCSHCSGLAKKNRHPEALFDKLVEQKWQIFRQTQSALWIRAAQVLAVCCIALLCSFALMEAYQRQSRMMYDTLRSSLDGAYTTIRAMSDQRDNLAQKLVALTDSLEAEKNATSNIGRQLNSTSKKLTELSDEHQLLKERLASLHGELARRGVVATYYGSEVRLNAAARLHVASADKAVNKALKQQDKNALKAMTAATAKAKWPMSSGTLAARD
jgi:septal ring factor EnvC (AmiA/AmiB activator)